MEDRNEIIKCFEERLKDLPDGKKIKLSNEEILKYFFVYNKKWNYYTKPYSQCVSEKFFSKIDFTKFVYEYYDRISMLIGADLSGSDFGSYSFLRINRLFLSPHKYEERYLRRIDAINRLDSLPTTNLSNINLSGEEWDLEKFLYHLIKNLTPYVREKYQKEINEENKVWEQIEETPHVLDFLLDYDLYKASKKVTNDVIKLAQKLIPNLQNTNLKIKFSKSWMTSIEYEIINYALQSGYFDGCNVQIHTNKIYISPSYKEELYYSEKVKSKKR